MADGGKVERKNFIRSYGGFATGAAKNLIEPLTAEAEARAKGYVPVDTGALKGSINSDVRGLVGMLKAGGPGARHAWLVEYGTQHAKAQPYLRRGVLAARRALKRMWNQAMKEQHANPSN